jgi:hypothetical protein
MATVLEECTAQEQRFVLRFCGRYLPKRLCVLRVRITSEDLYHFGYNAV